MWPIGEVAARLAKVRLAGYSGRDLLTLSSSRFDPTLTLSAEVCAWPATHESSASPGGRTGEPHALPIELPTQFVSDANHCSIGSDTLLIGDVEPILAEHQRRRWREPPYIGIADGSVVGIAIVGANCPAGADHRFNSASDRPAQLSQSVGDRRLCEELARDEGTKACTSDTVIAAA